MFCKASCCLADFVARGAGVAVPDGVGIGDGFDVNVQGEGGVAGGATGSARVDLEAIDNGNATRLTYDVDAAVTGKIAQLGSRLIEGTAKKLATKFFTDFITILSPESEQS